MEISSILENFKHKVEKAVLLLNAMESHDQAQAIIHWNEASQQIQDVINSVTTEASLQDEAQSLALRQMNPDRMREYIVATQMATMGITQYTIPSREHEEEEEITMSVVEMDHQHPPGTQVITHHIVQADGTVAEVGSPVYMEEVEEYSDEETVHMTISDSGQQMEEEEMVIVTSDERVTRNGDGLYQCELCDKVFNMQSQLNTHVWSHTKPYVCPVCEGCFSTRGNLMVHQRSHSGERPFPCLQCPMQFATKGNLKRHIATHTGNKPWSCELCKSCFTEKKSLVIHMRIHTGQRPYKCTVCGKAFSQSGVLKAHMAIHLNQKAHLCNKCGVSFRQKSQLKIHELRHGSLRRHECDICPAKFFTLGEVQRHHRVHTCERPFRCDLCTKSYTRKQSLIEHMHRHNGIKPYRCKYCEKCYAEQSACHKHVKSHERVKRKPNKPKRAVTRVATIKPEAQRSIKEEPSFEVASNQDAYESGERDPLDISDLMEQRLHEGVTSQDSTVDDMVTSQGVDGERVTRQDICGRRISREKIRGKKVASKYTDSERLTKLEQCIASVASQCTEEDEMTNQDRVDDRISSQDSVNTIPSQNMGDDRVKNIDNGDDRVTNQDVGDGRVTSQDLIRARTSSQNATYGSASVKPDTPGVRRGGSVDASAPVHQSVERSVLLDQGREGAAMKSDVKTSGVATGREQVVKILIKTPAVRKMSRQRPAGMKVYVIKKPDSQAVKKVEPKPVYKTVTYETLASEALDDVPSPHGSASQTLTSPEQLVAYVSNKGETSVNKQPSGAPRQKALPAKVLSSHEQLIADLTNDNLASGQCDADFTAINILANASTYQLHQ